MRNNIELGDVLRTTAMLVFICYSVHVELMRVPALEEQINTHEQTIEDYKSIVSELEEQQARNEKQLQVQTEKMDVLVEQQKKVANEKEELRKQVESLQTEVKKANEKVKAVSRRSHSKPVNTNNSRNIGNDFQVTWYNDYGKTKSGRFVSDGVTVAVDPSVIPLGTWLKITMPNGKEYVRRADDTGGAVKGNIVDIYANVSKNELYQRGRTFGVSVAIIN